MITYSKIGHFGRLGNQLFQFAGTIGTARKLGYEVAFPVENTTNAVTEHFSNGEVLDIHFDIPKVFNLDNNILKPKHAITTHNKASERFFHFDESLFNIADDCDLSGYLQTEKYFEHVSDEIKGLLTFREEIQSAANAIFPRSEYQTVSIHLRRGDYANLQQFHPVCDVEYYSAALENFCDNYYNFVVFSDDIEYCKNMFEEQENLLFLDNKDPFVDLCLMSMCDHNIIANSSFSWWGAWLNKNENKKVVAPKKWFGPAYQHNTSDLYCKNWIIK